MDARTPYRAVRQAGLLVVVTAPFAALLAVAGDSPYWLDSAEFVGAAFLLQPSHPPGHPLYVLLGHAASLLPIGTVAFRLALFSATCLAGALAATYTTAVDLIERGFGVSHPIAILPAAVACVGTGLSPGWMHQGTYAEVYALQALLTSLVVLCAARAFLPASPGGASSGGTDRGRWLLGGSLALGLALANHHLTGFILVPGIVAGLTISAIGRRVSRPFRLAALAVLLCSSSLLVYALLPVRGAVSPSLVTGRVESLSDLLWMVSAEVYQKSLGTGSLAGPDSGGVLFLVAEQTGAITGIVALGGLWFALRNGASRATGALAATTIAVALSVRALLSFDRTNPDVTGYLLPVLMLESVAVPAAVAALWGLPVGRRWIPAVGAVAVAAAIGWQVNADLPWIMDRARRGDGVERAQCETREMTVARVPPGSVIVTTMYSTSFMAWYGRVVEGERPDVIHVPLPFVGYRGEAAVLVETWKDLAPLVRGYLASGSLPASEVSSLSQERLVLVEPDPFLERWHIQYLEPHGIFMIFRPEPASKRDVMAAAGETGDRFDDLLGMGHPTLDDPQTVRALVWWLYNRALVLARRGAATEAIRAADQALSLVPGIPEIELLKRRLASDPGPVEDISPFLPR